MFSLSYILFYYLFEAFDLLSACSVFRAIFCKFVTYRKLFVLYQGFE